MGDFRLKSMMSKEMKSRSSLVLSVCKDDTGIRIPLFKKSLKKPVEQDCGMIKLRDETGYCC